MLDDPRPRPPGSATTLLPGAADGAYHDRLLAWMIRHPPQARPAAPRDDGNRPARVVLDTNVSLDLVVFRDPRWTGLLGQLARGACEALMDPACRQEFARVLGYPQFGLDPERRVRALEVFDGLHRIPVQVECRQDPVDGLPLCRDPDDQKFLELAFRARADALLSKDKALLKLARGNRRAGLFRILSPSDWLQCQAGSVPGT